MKKKSYQASNEYHVKYNRNKYKRIEIVFDKVKDKKTIEFLDSKENRAIYIKRLIEKDMKR